MTREEAIAKAAGLSKTYDYSATETERHYLGDNDTPLSYHHFDVAVDGVRTTCCTSYEEAFEQLEFLLKVELVKRVKELEAQLKQAKKALE